MKIPFVLGRMAFGGFFLYNGINHFRNRESLAQYAASKKIPAPDAAVTASGALLVAGGASMILGLKPKYGALAIIGFLAGVSPLIHDFWSASDETQRMNDMVNFTKNMALLASALAFMGVEEPWPVSVSKGKDLGRSIRRIAA
ncbi:MAG TPA: DoxX family protein [Bryobacteraceae bacterium]|nr:DoxX family protein [Bryobacteraceae bacterium]